MHLEVGECRVRYQEPRLARYGVLAYGDSLTAGYHSGGRGFAPYATAVETDEVLVDHIGLSGWTAAEMVAQKSLWWTLDQARAAGRPYDLAVCMAGTNDLGRRSPEAICDDVWTLHAKTDIPTIAIGIPESRYQIHDSRIRRSVDLINAELQRRCDETDKTTYVSCPVKYSDTTGFWEPDGLHMSKSGYFELGKALAPIIFHRLGHSSPS